MGDNEPIVETVEEGGEESSNRTFILLALGLGALFLLGLIAIVVVFLVQRSTNANTQAVNATQSARNAALIAAATGSAMPTETPLPTETPVPPTEIIPTATNTSVVVSSPTPSNTPGPTNTPGKPTATPTKTRTPTRTRAAVSSTSGGNQTPEATVESSTPASGIGGFGWVAMAGVLVAAVFVARRLRLSQR